MPRYTPVRLDVRSLAAERPALLQFILLSMLLHALVVLLFGTATGGGAGRGERTPLEQLDVTLRPLSTESGAGFELAPGADTTARGDALLRPAEGVSETVPNLRDAAPEINNSSAPTPLDQPAAARPSEDALPRFDRNAPAEADRPLAPTEARSAPPPLPKLDTVPPPPVPRELTQSIELRAREVPVAPTPLERVPPPAPSRELAASVELVPRPVPAMPPLIERIAPPPRRRDLTPAVEVPPRELPALPPPIERVAPPPSTHELAPAFEVPPRELPAVPAPIERVTPPPTARELAPAVEVPPRELPAVPTPIERVAPPPTARELAPAVEVPLRELPAVPAPIERATLPPGARELASPPVVEPAVRPSVPATPLERIAPPPVRPALPDLDSTVVRQRKSPDDASSPLAPAPAVRPPAAASPPAPNTPAATSRGRPAADDEELPRIRFATPDYGAEIFKQRRDVVVPSTEPGGSPHIDLDAARQRAREIASEGIGANGVFAVVPPPADPQSKDARAIEKAVKPDCRSAYAGLGLLAIPSLLASAIADSGCKW